MTECENTPKTLQTMETKAGEHIYILTTSTIKTTALGLKVAYFQIKAAHVLGISTKPSTFIKALRLGEITTKRKQEEFEKKKTKLSECKNTLSVKTKLH